MAAFMRTDGNIRREQYNSFWYIVYQNSGFWFPVDTFLNLMEDVGFSVAQCQNKMEWSYLTNRIYHLQSGSLLTIINTSLSGLL